jgi:hypothetical protein
MRPLGIPTLEDKLVQYAVARLLSAIYEADFLPCSYGYREGRSAQDAIRDLTDVLSWGRFEFVVEADIKGFFDHLRPEWLLKMLADAFVRALGERLAKFGLELAPDKTRRLRFGRGGREYNERFDFLGFELSWGKSRTRGHSIIQRRTGRKRLHAAIGRFSEWIKGHRSRRIGEVLETVAQKYRGHWGYYGIIGNSESLWHYYWATGRSLFKWLNRRSQRRSFTWPSFRRLLERYRVPRPRIMETARGREQRPSRPGGQPGQIEAVNLFGPFYEPRRA